MNFFCIPFCLWMIGGPLCQFSSNKSEKRREELAEKPQFVKIKQRRTNNVRYDTVIEKYIFDDWCGNFRRRNRSLQPYLAISDEKYERGTMFRLRKWPENID